MTKAQTDSEPAHDGAGVKVTEVRPGEFVASYDETWVEGETNMELLNRHERKLWILVYVQMSVVLIGQSRVSAPANVDYVDLNACDYADRAVESLRKRFTRDGEAA